jgi:hypothetical protein
VRIVDPNLQLYPEFMQRAELAVHQAHYHDVSNSSIACEIGQPADKRRGGKVISNLPSHLLLRFTSYYLHAGSYHVSISGCKNGANWTSTRVSSGTITSRMA